MGAWLSRVSFKRLFRYWRWRLQILAKRLSPVLKGCGYALVILGWASMGFLILLLLGLICRCSAR